LLLAQSEERATALHLAADGNHVEILKKLWVWAKEEQMNRNKLKKKLLLAKDKYGYTAWHQAAERGSLEALETLWRWAKEVELNPDELLLAQNEERETALHLAAKKNYEEIKIYKYRQNTTKYIILYHFWTTCFDSLESSSGPLVS